MAMPGASPPTLHTLLHRALAELRVGTAPSLAQARGTLEQALRLAPQQPDALQLLATVSRRQGDPAAAEALYRRSLQAAPRQAPVWNSLGNLLLADLARPQEAVACFEQALAIEPTHLEASYNRARALHAAGQHSAAGQAVERARALIAATPGGVHPLAPAVLQLLALLEAEAGRPQQALAVLDEALALAPQRAALHHNRAVALGRLHRAEEALQAHERAAALGLDDADAHYNRGNVLQLLGRLDEAAAAYRQALLRQPPHLLAAGDLARLRWRVGDENFDSELRAALQRQPDAAQPALLLGHLLWRAERPADAAEAFAEALRRAPGSEAHDGLGRCLVRLGRHDAGLAHHERAVALAPAADASCLVNQAASQLIAGKAAAAARSAQAALARVPSEQYALALLATAWSARGDARATRLHGGTRFIASIDLQPPPGWPTIEAFVDELARQLDALHHDRRAPIDQTLRHGTQTFGDILELPLPTVRALRVPLAQAIDGYFAGLPDDAGHPFLGRRGRGWRFADSWSSRLGASGRHVDHVHPHGWLSAAFYVQVPARCEDGQAREGWIRFGVPEAGLAAVPGLAQPPLLELQPRPGRLVLFPSLMWHGTRPFAGDGPRTTVSFDVVPLSEPERPLADWIVRDDAH